MRARRACSGGLCVLALGNDDEARQADRARGLWPGLRFAVGLHPHEARAFAGRVGMLPARDRCRLGGRHPAPAPSGRSASTTTTTCRRVTSSATSSGPGPPGPRAAAAGRHPHPRGRRRHAGDPARGRRSARSGGVFHCFSGTAALARAALDLGFHLSFSGIVTFPKAEALREIAAYRPRRPPAGRDRLPVPGAGAASRQAERAGMGGSHRARRSRRCAASTSPSVDRADDGQLRALFGLTARGPLALTPQAQVWSDRPNPALTLWKNLQSLSRTSSNRFASTSSRSSASSPATSSRTSRSSRRSAATSRTAAASACARPSC